MENSEYRTVIKYLRRKGLSSREVYEDMLGTLGRDCPSYATITKWYREFRMGYTSINDGKRSGRPSDARSQENINRVEKLINSDRRVNIHHIGRTLGLSYGTVQRIIHDDLKLKKLSARWVPRMLTKAQKKRRVEVSQQLLDRYNEDPDDFINRLLTQDETWVHHFDPETKSESMEWKHRGSPPPRKFKRQSSAGKVMASVFWDFLGVIHVDYLHKGDMINAKYYSDELKELKKKVGRLRRGKVSRGVLLLQDNASVHTAKLSTDTAAKCGFEILPHPAY